MQIDVASLTETEAFGRELGKQLFPGAVIGLIGPLGAGKTQLVRAIALGLGVGEGRLVTSPTFVLIQEYQGRLTIYHFDAYRLPGEKEFLDLGAPEYFQSDGVCLVEWADRVMGVFPPERLVIIMEITGETCRRLLLTAMGNQYENMIKPFAKD